VGDTTIAVRRGTLEEFKRAKRGVSARLGRRVSSDEFLRMLLGSWRGEVGGAEPTSENLDRLLRMSRATELLLLIALDEKKAPDMRRSALRSAWRLTVRMGDEIARLRDRAL
jgi:hypothetical protein